MIEANGKISGSEHRERNDSISRISLSSVKKKCLDFRENTKILNSFSKKKRRRDSSQSSYPLKERRQCDKTTQHEGRNGGPDPSGL